MGRDGQQHGHRFVASILPTNSLLPMGTFARRRRPSRRVRVFAGPTAVYRHDMSAKTWVAAIVWMVAGTIAAYLIVTLVFVG